MLSGAYKCWCRPGWQAISVLNLQHNANVSTADSINLYLVFRKKICLHQLHYTCTITKMHLTFVLRTSTDCILNYNPAHQSSLVPGLQSGNKAKSNYILVSLGFFIFSDHLYVLAFLSHVTASGRRVPGSPCPRVLGSLRPWIHLNVTINGCCI